MVGVVKRIGRISSGKRQYPSYPSVSRVAADPWVRGHSGSLAKVIDACEAIRREDPEAIQKLGGEWADIYSDLPYEGTVVYATRHHEIIEETGLEPSVLRPLRDALNGLPEPHEPQPYLAVLAADGDRMGRLLSQFTSPDEHRQFSAAVAGFAQTAAGIVREHRGVLIYAGGDDILAFVPLDKCLPCARKLHDEFSRQLGRYAAGADKPTLSVGIAIGHFMEDLEDLREWGREAEQAAKHPDRDGLAVHLYKRSGAPIRVRGPWAGGLEERLMRYAEWIRTQAIPSKLPYDLHKLTDVYRNGWSDRKILKEALVADVVRVIRDKQPNSQRHMMGAIEKEACARLVDAASLESFAEELLIARQIAVALSQAGGSGTPNGSSPQTVGVTES